ncbi:MAG: DUF6456 domain-containing protein [Pseudomonadota bacterium]
MHASTILRQVRAIEARREDVLVDRFLQRLGKRLQPKAESVASVPSSDLPEDLSETQLKQESSRVLGHLRDPSTVLAVVADMEKAVVVRESENGDTVRRTTLDRGLAEAMAFKGWIACDTPGKILKYRITSAGRTALSKFMAQAEMQAMGFHEDQTAFAFDADSDVRHPHRPGRFQSSETPLALLARRRDKDGQRFLAPELVAMGERLHEDFVLTGLSLRQDETWDQFICRAQEDTPDAPQAGRAQERLISALRDLGPGLGDAVLRCCCCLEGLELTEKRMGWSARSGKIVLRIALQRLKRHYAALGEEGALVG